MTEQTRGDVHVGDDLVALCVLGSNYFDGREQRRYHHEQARIRDVSSRADPAAEAKACRTGIAHSRVKLSRLREVPLGLECVWLRVILGVM
jgi:hypothetical protein